MFNFNLLNEAVFDTELTDKEFRLLYVIANNAAINKTNTVQLYNGWLMDKLDCCERQIRRLTNGLNQKGYVTKTVTGTSKNKNVNAYTLERTLQADKNVPPKTNENIEKNEDKPLNDAMDCAVSEENTIIDTQKCTEKCTENCPPKTRTLQADKNVDKNVPLKNNKKIKENNITIPVVQGPVVIETMKENIKPVEQIPVVIKEKKENEMNERSECNGMNATNGMSVVNGMNENEVKRNDAISSTTGNNDTVGKAYTQKDRPSSSETSNKAICDVQTPKMEQLPTEVEKVQQDAKEMPQTEREAKIASIMSNIELDKDVMFKAKTQMQFDAHFEDFKRNMANLKHLVSEDAYEDYRSKQGKWWKASVKYLIWYKDPSKKPSKPTKPTVEQMGNYQYHLDSMRIAQKIEDFENALNRMENWFEKMEALYTKTVMEQYWQKFAHDCASVKKSNPIFEEWQKKINQTIQ